MQTKVLDVEITITLPVTCTYHTDENGPSITGFEFNQPKAFKEIQEELESQLPELQYELEARDADEASDSEDEDSGDCD